MSDTARDEGAPDTRDYRTLVENLTPGHLTPQEFYDYCRAEADRTGHTAYDVAYQYALGVIGDGA